MYPYFQKINANKFTSGLDIRNVMTASKSFILKISAAACNAKAIRCLPSQPASTLSSPTPISRIYNENKVERDS